MNHAIMTRVTTIGSDVVVSGGAVVLHKLIGEAASTTVVTLKEGATTRAALAAGAIPLAGGVDFRGAEFPGGLTINITAAGGNVLVIWSPA